MFMGPTWDPPGSYRPQMGPMLAAWTLLSGTICSLQRYPKLWCFHLPNTIITLIKHINFFSRFIMTRTGSPPVYITGKFLHFYEQMKLLVASGTKWALLICSRNCCTWWRHPMEIFPRYWPFMRPVTRSLIFSLICASTNGWVNNRYAGDLRRHRAHYDVTERKRAINVKEDYVSMA